MPEIDFATLEKLNFALEIMGFSAIGWGLFQINKLIGKLLGSEAAGTVVETITEGSSIVDDIQYKAAEARAFVSDNLEDGVDEKELGIALRFINKAADKALKKAESE